MLIAEQFAGHDIHRQHAEHEVQMHAHGLQLIGFQMQQRCRKSGRQTAAENSPGGEVFQDGRLTEISGLVQMSMLLQVSRDRGRIRDVRVPERIGSELVGLREHGRGGQQERGQADDQRRHEFPREDRIDRFVPTSFSPPGQRQHNRAAQDAPGSIGVGSRHFRHETAPTDERQQAIAHGRGE